MKVIVTKFQNSAVNRLENIHKKPQGGVVPPPHQDRIKKPRKPAQIFIHIGVIDIGSMYFIFLLSLFLTYSFKFNNMWQGVLTYKKDICCFFYVFMFFFY